MKPAALLRALLTHKKVLIALAIITMLGVCCAGGVYGWRTWQHRQTPDYAVEKFRAALQPLNLDMLARMVDFNALTGTLARAIMEQEPPTDHPSLRLAVVQRELQAGLWKSLTEGADKSRSQKKEKDKGKHKDKVDLSSPLPADFAAQVADNMRFTPRMGMPLLQSSFRHPAEAEPVPLLLLLQRNAAGAWQVGELLNARELLRRLTDARQRQAATDMAAFQKKNEDIARSMRQLDIQHCEASATLLSDRTTLLVMVSLLARNKNDQSVNSANARVELRDAAGKKILERYLNTAKLVRPGEDFDYHWTLELDAHSAEGTQVRAAKKLQCEATWNSMLLENGKLLYLRSVNEEQTR